MSDNQVTPLITVEQIRELLAKSTQGEWKRDPCDRPTMQIIAVGNEVVAYHGRHERQVDAYVIPNFELMTAAPAIARFALQLVEEMDAVKKQLASAQSESARCRRNYLHEKAKADSLRTQLAEANERVASARRILNKMAVASTTNPTEWCWCYTHVSNRTQVMAITDDHWPVCSAARELQKAITKL